MKKSTLSKSVSNDFGIKGKNGQNLQQVLEEDILKDSYPPSPTPNVKTHDILYHITQLGPTDTAYTDLTGRFPYRSSRSNEYLLIGYDFDANAILAIPLKNRHAWKIMEAWRILNEKFAAAGVTPNTHVIDN